MQVRARFLRLVVLGAQPADCEAFGGGPVEAEVASVIFHGYDDT